LGLPLDFIFDIGILARSPPARSAEHIDEPSRDLPAGSLLLL
jgi:hypothetical protein